MHNSIRSRLDRLASGTAIAALLAAAMVSPVAVNHAAAQAIIDTTPDLVNAGTNFSDLFAPRPRSASTPDDIETDPGDPAGVDVQVRTTGYLEVFGSKVTSTFYSNGDIDIDVQDVLAIHPDQKGINAITGSGNIRIEAGDIESYSSGVHAEVHGFGGGELDLLLFKVDLPSFPAVGNVDIGVGNVTSHHGGGINAETDIGIISITAGDVTSAETGINATAGSALNLKNLGLETILGGAVDGISIVAGSVDAGGDGINAEIQGFSLFDYNIFSGIGRISIVVEGEDGPGDVAAGGNGINAVTGIGGIDIVAGDVTADGGFGINAQTQIGASLLSLAGEGGFNPLGLLTGGISIDVGAVQSEGTGINAETTGISAFGFDLPGFGGIEISAGNVTSGSGDGINAGTGLGIIAVDAGDVTAENGFGVRAIAGAGAAIVDVGNVLASGMGIEAHVTGGTFSDVFEALGLDDHPVIGPLDDGVGIAFVLAGDVTSTAAGGIAASVGMGGAGVIAGDVTSVDTGIDVIAGNGLAFAVAEDVTTTGDGATGINVEAGGIAFGHAHEHVRTGGNNAIGVRVVATEMTGPLGELAGSLAGLAGDVFGDLSGVPGGAGWLTDIVSGALDAVQGGIALAVVDDVTTTGNGSGGVWAEALTGVAGVLATGTVLTEGDNSAGITALAESLAVVLANNVRTDGENSDGIFVRTNGDATVLAGRVSTSSANSEGINVSVDGDANVIAGVVTTDGNSATGIDVYTIGEAFVLAGSVSTQQDFSDGIQVLGSAGATVIAGPVSTAGDYSHGMDVTSYLDVTVVALGDVDASGAESTGIHAAGTGYTAVTVLADVNGGTGKSSAGVDFNGENGGLLLNLGSIGSRNDLAIRNGNGNSTVANLGRVSGFVEMNDGNDTFINAASGTFDARGDSDFGDDEDEFINAGLVRLAERMAPASVTIAGLETFDNSVGGTISMQDGRQGDALILSDSDFVAGGFLEFDAELRAGGAGDVLTIGGDIVHDTTNASLTTALIVNDLDDGPGEYNPEGVVFAMVGGETDSADFTLNGGNGIDKGLFRYNAYLRETPVNDDGYAEWVLASTGDAEAYEFPAFAYGVQNLWHLSASTWLDRMADLRGGTDPQNASSGADYPAGGSSHAYGMWGRVFGGTLERDMSNVVNAPAGLIGQTYVWNDQINQRWLGFMAGFDFGEDGSSADGHDTGWVAGLMGGYTSSDLDFDQSNTRAGFRQGSVGAYASYFHGGLYIDAAVKGDFGRMNYKFSDGTGSAEARADYRSIGAIMEAGYRIDAAHGMFVEPKATLAYVHTSFDDFNVLGTDVAMDDASSLRGRLGLRIGARVNNGTTRVEPWLEASVWNEFHGDYGAVLVGNSFDLPVGYDAGGTIGEIAAGANLVGLGNGWTAYARGSIQFGGDEYRAYSGNIGLRKSW